MTPITKSLFRGGRRKLINGKCKGAGSHLIQQSFPFGEDGGQLFFLLAENSHEFIGMCDRAFTPFYVNPAGLELVGLADIEEAKRIPVKEYFFLEDQPFIMEEFFPRVVAQGKNEVEIRFRHFRTGEAIWMIYGVFALKDSLGALVGYATSSRDISERKAAEAALRAADRHKDEFLAVLAHELRNPLAAVRTGLEVLRRTAVQGKSSERMMEIMERQVTHLAQLVDDLLDVSRIATGKIELKKERVSLAASIQNAIDMSREMIDKSDLELRVILPEEPIFLDADPVRLAQVFANLLDNAVKYTDRGGRIEVTAEERGPEVFVTIADTGIGISPEMQPKVFDLFMQIDRSLRRPREGLGIGLALVREILTLHGGGIKACSEGKGRGSQFVVRLPLANTA